MSIFAGIYSRHGTTVPSEVVGALRGTISRSADDLNKLIEYADDRLFMAKVDVGAYGEVGDYSENSLHAFVAGAPILQRRLSEHVSSRSADLREIAEDVCLSQIDSLLACRGQFCAVVYDGEKQDLHLVVDKLGVRPIYYWMDSDFVVFSTALRVIEGLRFCRKTLDLRGIAELSAFGFPLGDRTAYENVSCLRSAELVSFSAGKVQRKLYWHWDNLLAATDQHPDIETRVYEAFQDAVKIRLGSDKITASFLSGGLDSRAIVAMLRSAGAEVLSVSYGPSGSQDELFGRLAAEKMGSRHKQIEVKPMAEGDAFSKASLIEWMQSPEYRTSGVDRPRLLWSGDGGSVGLGHVYLTEEMVELARANKISECAKKFLSHNRIGISTRILKPNVAAAMEEAIVSGVEEELRLLNPLDGGRKIHLFLMLNDQRRHLAAHFENIDLARIDLHEPFFDSEFLSAILREPIDAFLRHRFYMKWLEKFSRGPLDVPWQAYPGHEKCPIPVPAGLSYQWGSDAANRAAEKQRLNAIELAQSILDNKHFIESYVKKHYLGGALLLLKAGVRKRGYWFGALGVLHRYWTKAS